ncbi:MAG: flavodoxin family protein [Bacillota bacterium]
MKTLIVYFSLEGNTDYAAKRIAGKTGADTLRLVPKKAYRDKGFAKFVWGGKSAVMAEAPKLEDCEVDLAAYDRIVFGFPVWASNFTPPLRTFIKEHKAELEGKALAAFACQSGNGAPKALGKLKDALGIDSFDAEAVFIDPLQKQSEGTDAEIDAFGEELGE